jgi:hypothetical protein
MIYYFKRKLIIYGVILAFFNCKQPYFPPVDRTNLSYLVVDGTLVSGPDSTIINLSTTENVTDSAYSPNPEIGATVSVAGVNNGTYPLFEISPGKYVIIGMTLNTGQQYRLKITRANGEMYQSDTITLKYNPPIDSVTYTVNNGAIHFFVSTHDPANNTRYYRWNCEETWQYHSTSNSQLIFQNGATYTRNPAQQVYNCWNADQSTDILIGSSANLNQDVIFESPILVDSLLTSFYPPNIQLPISGVSQKFTVEYSLLVNQFALTADAFNYWQNLKQITEELGTIFSPEPSSELGGNMQCLTNPKEPVIGYVSACTEQNQRIFLNSSQVFTGTPIDPALGCYTFLAVPDSINYYLSSPYLYTPLDSDVTTTGVFLGIITAPAICGDCTSLGGANQKPVWWPF